MSCYIKKNTAMPVLKGATNGQKGWLGYEAKLYLLCGCTICLL